MSSTLEPFRSLDVFRQIDLIAVRDLMTFDYIPTPRTILDHVHKLGPGSRLEWSLGDGEPIIDRYWSPPPVESVCSVPDEFEVESLLDRAVQRQMISDVPIGAFLSGGIDSSQLTALMTRHSSKPVRTFSVAFADHDLDESPIARLVARKFGTEHTVLRAQAPGPDGSSIGRLAQDTARAASARAGARVISWEAFVERT